MRLLPSILLPISLQENIQRISTADFFKLLLQAGVRPQQQLEDFRRTPSFDYKGTETAEEMQSPTLCGLGALRFKSARPTLLLNLVLAANSQARQRPILSSGPPTFGDKWCWGSGFFAFYREVFFGRFASRWPVATCDCRRAQKLDPRRLFALVLSSRGAGNRVNPRARRESPRTK